MTKHVYFINLTVEFSDLVYSSTIDYFYEWQKNVMYLILHWFEVITLVFAPTNQMVYQKLIVIEDYDQLSMVMYSCCILCQNIILYIKIHMFWHGNPLRHKKSTQIRAIFVNFVIPYTGIFIPLPYFECKMCILHCQRMSDNLFISLCLIVSIDVWNCIW